MSSDWSVGEAIREHRHELINVLQIVRAYVQLGKPVQALNHLDDLADWLQSLTICQSGLGLSGESVLFQSARYPRLRWRKWNTGSISSELAQELSLCVAWLGNRSILDDLRRVDLEAKVIHPTECVEKDELCIHLEVRPIGDRAFRWTGLFSEAPAYAPHVIWTLSEVVCNS